jgi:hypothetical protein
VNILQWLTELSECQTDPERIDFDSIVQATWELRERIDNRTVEGLELDSMAELLEGIADELDGFLDSGLFYHIHEALQKARDLVDLRDLLEQQAGESLA